MNLLPMTPSDPAVTLAKAAAKLGVELPEPSTRTFYISVYDLFYDIAYQCEVNEETAENARRSYCVVSDKPIYGMRILPRSDVERRAILDAELKSA